MQCIFFNDKKVFQKLFCYYKVITATKYTAFNLLTNYLIIDWQTCKNEWKKRHQSASAMNSLFVKLSACALVQAKINQGLLFFSIDGPTE